MISEIKHVSERKHLTFKLCVLFMHRKTES